LLSVGLKAVAHNNGLAITPQMGWNTWNKFGCDISEDVVIGAAKAMVSSGLTKFGYEYVLIDDCWHAPARDPSTGAPVADPQKFPNGISGVADQVHAMGLKLGIYSDAGLYTCGGRFGSLGHEEIDAKTYASWGIDYLKYDNCYNEGQSGTPLISYNRYNNMSMALNATGRPILYSMCNWGEDQPWNFAATIANSWRIAGDIMDVFDGYDDRCPCESIIDCKLPGFHCAMARLIDFVAVATQKAGINHWNDMDIMEVGNGGMTNDEYITHFSMWSILKSPLIMGQDIPNQTNETFNILTNDAVIALNQDPLGSPANRLFKQEVPGGTLQLWEGSLVNSSAIVALMNTSPDTQSAELNYTTIFKDWLPAATWSYRVYDLWEAGSAANQPWTNSTKWGKDLGVFVTTLGKISVGSHQTRVLKLVVENFNPTTNKRNATDL